MSLWKLEVSSYIVWTNCGFTLLSQNATAVFELPSNASANGSVCDNSTSTLKLTFGEGHSWTMNFKLIGETYQADDIVFVYNLSDANLFHNASTGNFTPTKT